MRKMEARELKAFLKRRPFKPFRIRISSGQYVDIRRPDLFILGRTFFAAARRPDERGIAMGGVAVYYLIDVVKITTLKSRKPKGRRSRSA